MDSQPKTQRHGKVAEYLRRIGGSAIERAAAAGAGVAQLPPAYGEGPAPLRLPRKLYRASEIADHLGVTRQTVHNYATIGLITEEARTRGGQRLFDESVFGRIALIQDLKPIYRLHEIRRVLGDVTPIPARRSTQPSALRLRLEERLSTGRAETPAPPEKEEGGAG